MNTIDKPREETSSPRYQKGLIESLDRRRRGRRSSLDVRSFDRLIDSLFDPLFVRSLQEASELAKSTSESMHSSYRRLLAGCP